VKIAVVGSGGREHALLWSLYNEKKHTLYALPGNGGTAAIAENVAIQDSDCDAIIAFARQKMIDIVMIGPEKPLAMGLADKLRAVGVKTIGPDIHGAQVEASKIWAKEFMLRHSIPTARHETFDSYDNALSWIKKNNTYPVVIKADGLAAGKGVIIPRNEKEAEQALRDCFIDQKFGQAGLHIEIEEFLTGVESSYLVFVDGDHYVPMVTSKDHKRLLDGDLGPNTGGMGTFSPSPFITPEIEREILEKTIAPAVRGFQKENILYRGILYAGLMISPSGINVIEYNCRFGDPETQVIIPRLATPLSEVFDALSSGMLAKLPLQWHNNHTVCVVAASQGYPEGYEKGKIISGLDHIKSTVFHAGTTCHNDTIYTSGGRVLGVTATGNTLEEARSQAYSDMGKIHFDGMMYRNDIALLS